MVCVHVILRVLSFNVSVFYILGRFYKTIIPLELAVIFNGRWWKICNCYPRCNVWIQLPLENNLIFFLKCVFHNVSEGKWSRWSPWTDCSRTCGKGGQSRSRTCNDKVTGKSLKNDWCAGKPQQEKPCADWKCPGTFTN